MRRNPGWERMQNIYTGNTRSNPNTIVECPDEYSIVSLVRENFGIALMPQTDILLRCRWGSISTGLKGLQIYRQVFMFWMKDRYRLPAVERFIDIYERTAGRRCE